MTTKPTLQKVRRRTLQTEENDQNILFKRVQEKVKMSVLVHLCRLNMNSSHLGEVHLNWGISSIFSHGSVCGALS